jgi:hypothetical protein
MPSRPTRFASIVFIALLACTSCSKNEPDGGPSRPTQTEDAGAPPDISPTAAPGVAWEYSYDFQLPDEAISSVQEGHASSCEALGAARCRITGLRYSVNNDNAVSAMLQVKLSPDIARQFGKQATAAVTRASGRLSDMKFTGEDTAPAASQAARNEGEASRRIAEIQKQLSNPSLKDAERAQLRQQLSDLNSQLTGAQADAAATEAKLASTPMTFNYYGKGGISGFAGHNPVMDAVRSFVASLVTMITITLQLIALVLPWALLLLAIYLFIRSRPGRAIRRFLKPNDPSESSE